MEKSFGESFGCDWESLLKLGKHALVEDVHFFIMIADVSHPDVQGLMQMLQQITVNFYDGKLRIPTDADYIESLLRGIDAQASLHLKLCLCWTYVLETEDDKMWLRVTAKPYDFAAPIGYTTQ